MSLTATNITYHLYVYIYIIYFYNLVILINYEEYIEIKLIKWAFCFGGKKIRYRVKLYKRKKMKNW